MEKKKGDKQLGFSRDLYASEMLDDIFIYFMRTALHFSESGIEKLPLEQDFEEPVHSFLNLAIRLMTEGEPPETAEVILKSEYDFILSHQDCSMKLLLCLNMIRKVSCHMHYDEDPYSCLMDLGNLWGRRVTEYAAVTFYPNLSLEMQEKYQLTEWVRKMPAHMLRPDDY